MKSRETTIKFVKKAGMWCKTSWKIEERGKEKVLVQHQDWFDKKPNK